jgi:hypothetical protein
MYRRFVLSMLLSRDFEAKKLHVESVMMDQTVHGHKIKSFKCPKISRTTMSHSSHVINESRLSVEEDPIAFLKNVVLLHVPCCTVMVALMVGSLLSFCCIQVLLIP